MIIVNKLCFYLRISTYKSYLLAQDYHHGFLCSLFSQIDCLESLGRVEDEKNCNLQKSTCHPPFWKQHVRKLREVWVLDFKFRQKNENQIRIKNVGSENDRFKFPSSFIYMTNEVFLYWFVLNFKKFNFLVVWASCGM